MLAEKNASGQRHFEEQGKDPVNQRAHYNYGAGQGHGANLQAQERADKIDGARNIKAQIVQ